MSARHRIDCRLQRPRLWEASALALSLLCSCWQKDACGFCNVQFDCWTLSQRSTLKQSRDSSDRSMAARACLTPFCELGCSCRIP